MSNQSTYEKIEAYLNGTLLGSELTDFEEKMKSNKELATQVLLYQEVDEVLSNEPALDFQKIIQTEGDLFFEEQKLEEKKQNARPIRKIGGRTRRWAIAASFLLFVMSAVLLWQLQSNQVASNKDLFAQYSNTYNLNKDLRGGDISASEFEKGIQFYKAKDFKAAAQTFETLNVEGEEDMVLIFCLAHSYFNQKPPQLDLAQQQFEKIIVNGSSIYVPKAQWYKALIALEKGDLEQAKILLKKVQQSGDRFGKKATELLEELK